MHHSIAVPVVDDSTCVCASYVGVLQAELARNEEQQKQFTERLQHERTKLTGVLEHIIATSVYVRLEPAHGL
jgi:hypothetical protein